MRLPDPPIEVASPTDCRAGNLVLLGLNGCDLGWGTRYGGREAPRVTRRPGPLPLGYEPYDVHLCRLGQFPVSGATLAHGCRMSASGSWRLPRLSAIRCVSCTNPCTSAAPCLGTLFVAD